MEMDKELVRIVGEIYDLFKKNYEIDVVGIGCYFEKKREIEYRHFIESGQSNKILTINVDEKKSISGWCLENKEEVLMNDMEAEMRKYSCSHIMTREKMGSGYFAPIIVCEKVLGFLTVQSKKKNIFDKNIMDMVHFAKRMLKLFFLERMDKRLLTENYHNVKVLWKMARDFNHSKTIDQAGSNFFMHLNEFIKYRGGITLGIIWKEGEISEYRYSGMNYHLPIKLKIPAELKVDFLRNTKLSLKSGSAVMMNLSDNDEYIGYIILNHENCRYFEDSKEENFINTSVEMLTSVLAKIKKNEELEREISDRKAAQNKLTSLNNSLTTVRRVGEAVTATKSIKKMVSNIHEILNEEFGECSIGIGVNEYNSKRLIRCFMHEMGSHLEEAEIFFDDSRSFMVKAVSEEKEIIIEEFSEKEFLLIGGSKPSAVAYFPLRSGGDIVGCFTYQIFNRGSFTSKEIELCREIIPILSISINNYIEHEKLKYANKILKNLSITDHLTGLYNRRHFYEKFDMEWNEAKKKKEKLHIFLIDFDNFKYVNDNFGHHSGDRVLTKAAGILNDEFAQGYLGRYGGDEFIGGMRESDTKKLMEIGEKVRKKIEDMRVPINSEGEILTVSIGIFGIVPRDDLKLRDYFVKVDDALYTAKRNGKNRVIYYETD